ncbi:hypothetical protein KAR48_10695 [bacterium]|nr:hypothetical protein [bacterium]
MMSTQPIRALALMSFGLDSLLAAKMIKDQGIDVHGITFFYRFDNLAKKKASGEIFKNAELLGIPVTVIDISDDFLPILLDPPHGYGTNFNPCIDCHLYMFTRANAMMEEMGAKFLITGEVIGQRPMSQNSQTMAHMNKVMEFSDILVRPLSALHFPETLPEREGWIDRAELLDISGRSRKRQFELAEKLGVTQFPGPGGGCILTVPQFGDRAKKLKANRLPGAITVEDLELLRYGRHLWPYDHLHVIVGRDADDNDMLEQFVKGRTVFEPLDVGGPLVLAEGVRNEDDIKLIAEITARYCGKKAQGEIRIEWKDAGKAGIIYAKAYDIKKCENWRI